MEEFPFKMGRLFAALLTPIKVPLPPLGLIRYSPSTKITVIGITTHRRVPNPTPPKAKVTCDLNLVTSHTNVTAQLLGVRGVEMIF